MKIFWKKTWIIICALIFGTACFLVGCKDKNNPQSEPPISESVEQSSDIVQESSEESSVDISEENSRESPLESSGIAEESADEGSDSM